MQAFYSKSLFKKQILYLDYLYVLFCYLRIFNKELRK